jgi:4-alpha-glucanotransferase
MSWYKGLDERQQKTIYDYLGHSDEKMPWMLIRCALASTSRLAVIPMQDLLPSKYAKRMNTPGKSTGNWNWRFDWQQLDSSLASKLSGLNRCYDRVVSSVK